MLKVELFWIYSVQRIIVCLLFTNATLSLTEVFSHRYHQVRRLYTHYFFIILLMKIGKVAPKVRDDFTILYF